MAKDQEFLEDMAILKDKELLRAIRKARKRGVDVMGVIENALNEREVCHDKEEKLRVLVHG